MRVAVPVADYVDEGPLAAGIDAKDARVGGDVETKASPAMETTSGDQSKANPEIESRVGGNVETRAGGNVETKCSP